MDKGASERQFVDAQKAYWREVDEAHFRWQTEGAYIAGEEAALIDGIAVARGGRLLEIGCGEGGNLHHLAARLPGVRLFGVDFTLEKARFAGGKTGAITAAADAARLPFCNAAFDAILIRDLLHHVPDRAAVLVEALRVLAPGGQLLLVEPNGKNPLIAALAAAVRAERGMLSSTAARARAELVTAGFAEISVEERQALPISRVLFHYKMGAPSLAGRPEVARLIRRLERIAERLPRALWAYFVIHGRKR